MVVVDVLDHQIGSQLLEECSTNGKLDVDKAKALNDKLGWFKDSKKLEMAMSVIESGLFDVDKFAEEISKNYSREVAHRELLGPSFAPLIVPSESPERMSACVPTITAHPKLNLSEFPYVLALDLDEAPTLEHKFIHCRASKEDMLDHLKAVASALDYMHNKGLVHCDLRLCNIYLDDKILIGNLEASTKIGAYFPHGQFTTGVLPPELFYKLQNDEERQLYEDCWGQHPGWSTRFKPARGIVVKAWAKSKPLPYEPVEATPSADSLAFGCMLFHVLSGEELVQTNAEGHVVSNSIETWMNWTAVQIKDRVRQSVSNPSAIDLLLRLLATHPQDRITMSEVINHKYFLQPADSC
ncbi:hypothetical protein AC1031_000041 [Aphanomyces cochlioides]|nr:hypothetical protein AC1031_000041 [Aphanomyces cochlioides]